MRTFALCVAACAATAATAIAAAAAPGRTTRSTDCDLPGVTIIVTPGQPGSRSGNGLGGQPGKPGSVICNVTSGGSTSSGSSSSTSSSTSGGRTTQTLSSNSTTAVVKTTPQTFGGASASVTSQLVSPRGAGLAPGAQAVSLTVTGASEPFPGAIDIAFPGAPAAAVPAWSRSGSGWTQLSKLGGTTLAGGQADGWFRNGDTIHVLTRHAGQFGLANAGTQAQQAPLPIVVTCPSTVDITKPWLSVRIGPPTTMSVQLVLLRNATPVATWHRTVAQTSRGPLRLQLPQQARKTGHYRLQVKASAGDRSVVRSRGVVFVR